MAQSPTDALRDFLGPIMAEYARLIDEFDGEMPVTISFGNYKYETKLEDFKKLDRAYQAAFERNQKAAETRHIKKSSGLLI